MMIIDRIENGWAVVETDSGMTDISLSELPEDIKEGDIIVPADGAYMIDREATESRRREIVEMLRRVTGGKK